MQRAALVLSASARSASINKPIATAERLTMTWPDIPAVLPRGLSCGFQLSDLSSHSAGRATPRAGRGCEGGRKVQPDAAAQLHGRTRPKASPTTTRYR